MESGGVQGLTAAFAGLGFVLGALGLVVATFVLVRGAPTRLETRTHECVTTVTEMEGKWEAARSGLEALLDSIHTERENVQKAHNRLSGRERKNGPDLQRPHTREEALAQLRRDSGMT